jgi:hypothetical protein
LTGADLRGLPWLVVMGITMRPGIKVDRIIWDGDGSSDSSIEISEE